MDKFLKTDQQAQEIVNFHLSLIQKLVQFACL